MSRRLAAIPSAAVLLLLATGLVACGPTKSTPPAPPPRVELRYRGEIVLDARRRAPWKIWLPIVDPRWPNLTLSIAPIVVVKPGMVTGWIIALAGPGDDDMFYPKTPGFHGPGPMTVGWWLAGQPETRRHLTVDDPRFKAVADVLELTGELLDAGANNGVSTGLTRARVALDLTWMESP